MTELAEYTGEEWSLLLGAPEVVGWGMLAMSGSGPVGKLREFLALRACLRMRGVPADLRKYRIIRTVLASTHTAIHRPGALPSIGGNPVELLATLIAPRQYMLEYSERIARLLEHTAPHDEAEGFKRWLMWIARRVAGASGIGWLGTGTRMSDNESGMLNLLAESLHLVTAADVATTVEAETLPYMRTEPANTVDASSNGNEPPES
ncbi:MAG: hypothetical protein ACXVA4_06995 [Ktedonobacterales bacterium]